MSTSYIFLSLAILAEVIATSSLKYTDQFSKFWPSVVVLLGYGAAFYFLSLSLKELNLGIAYAIWCGVGIAAIALIQHFWFKSPLDFAAIVGIALITLGVLVIQLFSGSVHQDS